MSETRGRGRPKLVDETELAARIRNREDLWTIREALLANGEPPISSSSCIVWLDTVRSGDVTGGVSRRQANRLRAMLARLPEIPLPPASKRRRSAAARGLASPRLLAAVSSSGMLAFAAMPGPVALRAILALGAPIMPERTTDAGAAEIPGRVVPLGRELAGVSRECVPGARSPLHPARVGCALLERIAA